MHITTPSRPRTARRHGATAGLTALVALAVLAVGCTSDRNPLGRLELPSADWIAELLPAQDCDSLVAAAEPALRRTVEAWWPEAVDPGWFGGGGEDSMTDSAPQEAARADAGAAASGPATTMATAADSAGEVGGAGSTAPGAVIGTNNQEAAVDEADLVKTDGRRLVTIVNGVLRVVELDGSPAIDGSLDLQLRGATDLFLRGDTALVLGTTYGGGYGAGYGGPAVLEDRAAPPIAGTVTTTVPATEPSTTEPSTTEPGAATTTTTPPTTTAPTTTPPTTAPTTSAPPTTTTTVPLTPPPFAVATTLTMVSLAGPAGPRITATADVEGSLVTARDAAGRARVVVQSTPLATERLGMAVDREQALAAVERVDAADLLPRVATSGEVAPLGGCRDVLVTPVAAGATDVAGGADATWSGAPPLDTVTVLTVGDDLADLAPVSVQGSAGTVYASTGALYVAGASWDEAGSRTDVHRFSLTGDGPAAYTGSGRAPGHLLDQFSLSEREGALRLVTTLDGTGAPVPIEPGMAAVDIAPSGASSARLTVLDTEGTLDEIGHLDGMGVGEQVQSVRFLDDVAYVVTFRQTDPLYAVDLSDPRSPQLLGELKIPGFSEYLHPVGEGLLIGVGRQVDPVTGIDEGLKVSLFDVTDPVRMAELDQIVLPGASSEVSVDHRAFQWDPTRRQAIVPVELGGCSVDADCTAPTGGAALVVRADRDGLREVGRFSHEPAPGWSLQPNRTVVVGDDLWSVSIAAIGRTDADEPTGTDLVRF